MTEIYLPLWEMCFVLGNVLTKKGYPWAGGSLHSLGGSDDAFILCSGFSPRPQNMGNHQVRVNIPVNNLFGQKYPKISQQVEQM